jgi:SAM-dependent methyltransferase
VAHAQPRLHAAPHDVEHRADRGRADVPFGAVLVHALEPDWERTLVEVAARFRLASGLASADAVRELSAVYNELPARAGAPPAPFDRGRLRGSRALAARLAFFFPRDVPKGAGAVRELVATGRLTMPERRPLRVLDLGAGLGATSRGALRALAARGACGPVELVLADDDREALAVARALWEARPAEGGLRVSVELRAEDVARRPSNERFDLVLMGQVLCELGRDEPAAARVASHAALLQSILARAVHSAGSLVVVEPALRARARHLHAVRDAVVASGRAPFAPCLHAERCPMLAGDDDWCHEDLPVDLPSFLVPLARAANLRWQGVTFAYLVLRPDGATLREAGPWPLRVVSERRKTKGKEEAWLCGLAADGAGLVRATRLDRDRSERNAVWDLLRRGDRMRIEPPPAVGEFRLRREVEVRKGPADDAA